MGSNKQTTVLELFIIQRSTASCISNNDMWVSVSQVMKSSSFMLVMFRHVKDGVEAGCPLSLPVKCRLPEHICSFLMFGIPQQLRQQQLRIRDADSILESAVFPPFASHLETGHLLFFSLTPPLSGKSPPTAFYTVLPSAGPPSVFSHHPKYTPISHMN